MPRFARCVFAVFLAVSCLSSSLTCQAAVPETAAAAFILMEADSGRVLASRNETQERSIASTTKIMTCLIALEHSELTEQVTVKREHLREGSSMYLLEGETLTMEELLYGLMLPSGNDAAECIAAHCGGSGGSAQFVRWMNEKAKALGMKRTLIMRRIVLPQAMRIIIPPTGNEFIGMLKTTSLVNAVPFTLELQFATTAIATRLYKPIPLLIVACIWYLVITSILMVIQSRLEKHFGKGFDARPAGARGKRTPLPGKTFGEPKDDVDKQNEATFAGMTA